MCARLHTHALMSIAGSLGTQGRANLTRHSCAVGSPCPHLHCDWARSCHIRTGTGLTPAASAPGLDSPLPHLHRDWTHPCHICTRSWLAAGTWKRTGRLTPGTTARAMARGGTATDTTGSQDASMTVRAPRHVACSLLPVARCLLSVACCTLHTLHVARCMSSVVPTLLDQRTPG
jgi:hypothetical protein